MDYMRPLKELNVAIAKLVLEKKKLEIQVAELTIETEELAEECDCCTNAQWKKQEEERNK